MRYQHMGYAIVTLAACLLLVGGRTGGQDHDPFGVQLQLANEGSEGPFHEDVLWGQTAEHVEPTFELAFPDMRPGDPSGEEGGPELSPEQQKTRSLQMQDHKYSSQSHALMVQYRKSADDTKKRELRDRLQKVLESQFTTRQELQELQLSKVEERLRKLREQLERRKEERSTIVRYRLEQLVREADGLGWGNTQGNNDFTSGGGFFNVSPPDSPHLR